MPDEYCNDFVVSKEDYERWFEADPHCWICERELKIKQRVFYKVTYILNLHMMQPSWFCSKFCRTISSLRGV